MASDSDRRADIVGKMANKAVDNVKSKVKKKIKASKITDNLYVRAAATGALDGIRNLIAPTQEEKEFLHKRRMKQLEGGGEEDDEEGGITLEEISEMPIVKQIAGAAMDYLTRGDEDDELICTCDSNPHLEGCPLYVEGGIKIGRGENES